MGESFRYPHHISNDYDVKNIYLNLLRLFLDNNTQTPNAAPYSIHNIVQEGAKLGRKPGDWYGP